MQFIFKLIFFGGCLIGCSLGFMNVLKIKGIYNVMKSGMLVVEFVFDLVIDEEKVLQLLIVGKG